MPVPEHKPIMRARRTCLAWEPPADRVHCKARAHAPDAAQVL